MNRGKQAKEGYKSLFKELKKLAISPADENISGHDNDNFLSYKMKNLKWLKLRHYNA